MTRWLVFLLLCAYASVPPGLCQCRLEALLFAAQGETESSSHDEEHDDCGCTDVKADFLPSACASCAAPQETLAGVAADSGAEPRLAVKPAADPPDNFLAADIPLYLTLRALRI
jgi:hypothetical protein